MWQSSLQHMKQPRSLMMAMQLASCVFLSTFEQAVYGLIRPITYRLLRVCSDMENNTDTPPANGWGISGENPDCMSRTYSQFD